MRVRLLNQGGIRHCSRISIKQTLLICEHQECIRIDEIGYQRRQGVVIAKANLVSHHRVVFVHDRDNTLVQQRLKRCASVKVAIPRFHIIVTEQDLRTNVTRGRKRRLVSLH